MAESELAVLTTQCLSRRIPDKQTPRKKVVAWQSHRNKHHAKADWQFTTENARVKLKRLYPADSGHRDQPIRLIVITQTGDRDHAAHLGRGVPGAQHGVALVVTTDGCSLSHSFVVFVKHVNPAQ